MSQMQSVADLAKIIEEANDAYFNSEPIMEDPEYDRLKDELRQQNPDHPLLQQVGAPVVSSRTKVKHSIPMGSQSKVTNEDELVAWHTGVGGSLPLIATLKLDGFSLALYYEAGVLVRAVTRGDGFIGEDITDNARKFRNIPEYIPEFTGAVRGEVVLNIADWEILDPGKQSNPRNLASGIGRRKFNLDEASYLSFYAFDIHGKHVSLTSELSKIRALADVGFTPVEYNLCATVHEAVVFHNQVESSRKDAAFWMDAVVFKINDLKTQATLGSSGNCPRGQVAYKFKCESAITRLTGVELTVGHTGAIIPTAVLEPVQIGGTTVKSALLCNWNEISRLGVAIGDTVEVAKMGDIIPKIILRLSSECTSERQEIKKPSHCPVCKHDTEHRSIGLDGNDGRSASLYCSNSNCPAVLKGKIRRWIRSLDIQGIGDEVLSALMADNSYKGRPIIRDIPDLYKLDSEIIPIMGEVLVNGRRLGESRAWKILAEIDQKRSLTVDQVLGSLGIPHLGKRRVQAIREAWERLLNEQPGLKCGNPSDIKSWFSWSGSCLEAMAASLGIPHIAYRIQYGIDNSSSVVKKLLSSRVQIVLPARKEKDVKSEEGPLKGMAFVLTGKMSRPRDEIARDLQAAGAQVWDAVKASPDGVECFLVQADPASKSSKTAAAAKRGWGIIDESTAMNMRGNF